MAEAGSKELRKTRMSWMVLGLVVLCLSAALGYLLLKDLEKAFSDYWNARITSEAEGRATAISVFLEDELAEAEVVADNPLLDPTLVQEGAPADRERSRTFLQNAVNRERYAGSWLLDSDQRVLVGTEDIKLEEAGFVPIRGGSPVFGILPRGEEVAILLKIPISKENEISGYLVIALSNAYVQELFRDLEPREPKTHFTVAARTARGWTEISASAPSDSLAKRLVVSRRVASFPPVVTASLDKTHIRDSQTNLLSSFFLLVSTVVLGLGTVVYGYLRQQRLHRSVRDLTERVDMQKKVDQARRSVTESQKMEALGLLAGGVAHDFNNLLTVIGGYAELHLGESDNKDYAREMKIAVDRAKEITGQLLTLSRRHPSDPVALNISQVFKNTMLMVSRLFPEDLKLDWECDDEELCVCLNQAHSDQLFLNLLINARDAVRGAGVIKARLARRVLECKELGATGVVGPGRYIEFSIEDSGCGMTEEVASRIFDPFFTTKPDGQGTGMGLAVVFGIVKTAGGGIFFRSRAGEGTVFQVLLPEYHGPLNVQEAAPVEVSFPPLKKALRIALVEDEMSLRTLLERALCRAGFKVECASSGIDAVEEFANRADEFDVLVTDVVMPGLRGPSVAAHLREHNPELRVIFMSGYVDGTLGEFDFATDQFLQKPFSPKELIETLEACRYDLKPADRAI